MDVVAHPMLANVRQKLEVRGRLLHNLNTQHTIHTPNITYVTKKNSFIKPQTKTKSINVTHRHTLHTWYTHITIEVQSRHTRTDLRESVAEGSVYNEAGLPADNVGTENWELAYDPPERCTSLLSPGGYQGI